MSLLDTTLNLYRATIGQDAGGGKTATVPGTATLAGIPCAVQPLKSYEQFDYARRQIEADVKIYSNYDFDSNLSGGVKIGDQLKDPVLNFTYVVKATERNSNSILSPNPLYKIVAKRLIV